MLIKEMNEDSRPRERLIKYGVSSLSNQDLLAIILKVGTKNKSVFELSNDILNSLNNISDLKECGINWLLDIKGIGFAKACEVMASIELGKRLFMNNSKSINRITSSEDVYNFMKYFLKDNKQEYFYCLYLNNKNEILERKLL